MFEQSNRLFWLSLVGVCILLLVVNALKIGQRVSIRQLLPKDTQVDNFSFGNIKLMIKDDAWYLEKDGISEPADNQNVDNFIAKSRDLVLDKPLSNNRDNFEKYGIDEKAPVLSLGGKSFIIGYLGENLETTFIKPTHENYVYEIKSIWGNREPSEIKYWYKRVITNFPLYQISKIDIGTTVVNTSGEAWYNEPWVRKVAFLVADKYIGKEQPEGEVYRYEVYYGKEKNELVFSKKWVKNGIYYYELDPKDFELLTKIDKKG